MNADSVLEMPKSHLHTKPCDMLDIKYPIILAGMGGISGPISGPELVAAVSNAGGLDVPGCVIYNSLPLLHRA
jgi:NAD(P)H-dependent flavin oxidoreductase YrpB (nitropropane dioxygenase family)